MWKGFERPYLLRSWLAPASVIATGGARSLAAADNNPHEDDGACAKGREAERRAWKVREGERQGRGERR